MWCLAGDYNSVRRQTERVGISQRENGGSEAREFNTGIADMWVEDVPCLGQAINTLRPNGQARSRLDRVMWLKQGDCNSKYYHMVVNWKRCSNMLRGVHVNGVWMDDPANVKDEVLNFFRNRFLEPSEVRPGLDGVVFNVIDEFTLIWFMCIGFFITRTSIKHTLHSSI